MSSQLPLFSSLVNDEYRDSPHVDLRKTETAILGGGPPTADEGAEIYRRFKTRLAEIENTIGVKVTPEAAAPSVSDKALPRPILRSNTDRPAPPTSFDFQSAAPPQMRASGDNFSSFGGPSEPFGGASTPRAEPRYPPATEGFGGGSEAFGGGFGNQSEAFGRRSEAFGGGFTSSRFEPGNYGNSDDDDSSDDDSDDPVRPTTRLGAAIHRLNVEPPSRDIGPRDQRSIEELVADMDIYRHYLRQDPENKTDIAHIPEYTSNMSYQEVKRIHDLLLNLYGSATYRSLGHTVVFGGAKFLEYMFDGSSLLFNKYPVSYRGLKKSMGHKLSHNGAVITNAASSTARSLGISPNVMAAIDLLSPLVMTPLNNLYDSSPVSNDDQISALRT